MPAELTPAAPLLELATQALELARRHGADEADLVIGASKEFEVKVCAGEIVTLTQAVSKALGLRVFVGGRLGFCTTSDFSPAGLTRSVSQACALAREAHVDPHHGLADAPAGTITAGEELELYDPAIPALSAEQKIDWAHALEAAARDADPRVTRFRDSGVASGEQTSLLVTSRGAVRVLRGTHLSWWSNPIAEADGELQTEVWWDSKTHLADLESPAVVGRTAGLRAARMLGARPVQTQRVPVIFEPSMAASLAAGLIGAIDGDRVYKRASFLADRLGASIAAPRLTIYDDPLLRRGLGSAPFDGEGLPTTRKALVDAGRLTTFLYDSTTARRAGVAPTANARRGPTSLPHPGPFNVYVAAGEDDPTEILRSAPRALLVTRGLGHGLNTVSGEYSRGANGLWLEHGEVVHPVQEVTIAGDYLAMLGDIDRIGSDLSLRGTVGAPTLRIAEMTVSGR